MEGINVLSCFDGMSCGQIALKELGVNVNKYYASEIDKFAIKQTESVFKSTIHMGSIEDWREWNIDYKNIDLIFGGSPCQGFSFAGDQLAFNDPRSKLIIDFIELIKHVKKHNKNVKLWIENVRMKKVYINVISRLIGVEPIEINSSLVSAQNRARLYWANFDIGDIADKGIKLKDILEKNVDEKYYYSEKAISYLDRKKINKRFANYKDTDIAHCLTANYTKGLPYNVYVDREKSNCITDNYMNMACVNYNKSQGQIVFSNNSIRRLTVRECMRLQTVPEWYEFIVSDSQSYKMLGNGWTIDIIKELIKSAIQV